MLKSYFRQKWIVTIVTCGMFFIGGAETFASAETELACPGAGSNLSLSIGEWIIRGDCQTGDITLSGTAQLRIIPVVTDPANIINAKMTIAGRVSLSDTSTLIFNHVDIIFPQTYIYEFVLEAHNSSRVRVANSTILTMDHANAPTHSMFWKFFDNSATAVTDSSRLGESWLMLSQFGHSYVSYGNSVDFFMEAYQARDEPTTFIASGGSIGKLWLNLSLPGDYQLFSDKDLRITKPFQVMTQNLKYAVGVVLQSVSMVNSPKIRLLSGSYISLNLGLIGDLGGPVTLHGLTTQNRTLDEYLPPPFNSVLLQAGVNINQIQVYVVSTRQPVTISNSFINEIGVMDAGGVYNPDPCDPCSEARVENSIIGWADIAAIGLNSNRKAKLTIQDTDIWNQTIFATQYGDIHIMGTSAILGGAFVESLGAEGCSGTCSNITIDSTVTTTPNPACPASITDPNGLPLCQPYRETGTMPSYQICNGGEIINNAYPTSKITTCTPAVAP
jgi:hypothetical protein